MGAAAEGMDALGTARAFAAALASGDGMTATALLADDVVIYESGGQESSRAEYTSHHLQLDISFLAGLKVQVVDQKHEGTGDIAWVITRSRLTGAHKGKPVDLYSTESLVLKHSGQGWKIVHIHWSSQPASSKPD
jgi:ketosteroid isomerase-like protein